MFFIALFHGFISPGISIGFQSLVYGMTFLILVNAFIFRYAMLAMYLVQATLAPQINVDKVSGLALFGVGLLSVFKGYKDLPAS